ncbi:hypothetical protein GCM10008929_20790 [Alkalibacterium psychrotolerans]
MKKRLVTIISLLVIAGGSYLLAQSGIRDVPDANEISTLCIEINRNRAVTEDRVIIKELIDELNQSRRTYLRSNGAEPGVKPFWRIELTSVEGSKETYYFYESEGNNYIERPYEEIYVVDILTNDFLFRLYQAI